MTAWGVVGTGGNLGGVIGTPLVAVLSAHHAWTAAFLTGTGRRDHQRRAVVLDRCQPRDQ